MSLSEEEEDDDFLSADEGPADNEGSEHEDEEEDVTESVRERNLKIARKFSAELAKNLNASSPIPVKSGSAAGLRLRDTSSGTSTPDHSDPKSSLPPAPPPTPALSSSFNSEEPNAWTSSGSQYSWRIPPKSTNAAQQKSAEPDSKSQLARQALDRLSENSCFSDKNLFERIADDIKKVSIGGPDMLGAGEGATGAASGIPIISDLGSSLGGWGWGGASKLLASASQVTSQISTVLDSVLQVQEQTPISSHTSARQLDGAGDHEDTSTVSRTDGPLD